MDEFRAQDMFEADSPADDWEIPDDTPIDPGFAQGAQPPPPPPPRPEAAPKDPPMYEPEAQDNSGQWAPYDNTAAIPPEDDFAPDPPGVSQPPPGRTYGMYRQQPTWQHASLQGVEGAQIQVGGLLQGVAAIAGGAILGYGLTGSPKVAAGSALGMIGLLQVPTVIGGHFLRSAVGVAAVVGAYFLMRDELEGFDGVFQPNDGYDDEDYDEDEDDEGAAPEGDPERSSPWMKDASDL
jgi:hypothetical protein